MKNSHSIKNTALAVALASLALSVATSADPEEDLVLEAERLPVAVDVEATPLGLVDSGTRTIDGTGLRAVPGQETDTIDGTGWRPNASNDTDTIDGTGLIRTTPNIDLAASGQTLRTVDSDSSNDDCEVPAGVNAADSGHCEPANPEFD